MDKEHKSLEYFEGVICDAYKGVKEFEENLDRLSPRDARENTFRMTMTILHKMKVLRDNIAPNLPHSPEELWRIFDSANKCFVTCSSGWMACAITYYKAENVIKNFSDLYIAFVRERADVFTWTDLYIAEHCVSVAISNINAAHFDEPQEPGDYS